MIAALSKMLLEALERLDGGLASEALLLDLRDLYESAERQLLERDQQ